MRVYEKLKGATVFFAIIYFIFPQEAYAFYLDPGSGSLLIQIIIAGLVGAAYVIRLYWKRIKEFFGLASGQNEHEHTEHSDQVQNDN